MNKLLLRLAQLVLVSGLFLLSPVSDLIAAPSPREASKPDSESLALNEKGVQALQTGNMSLAEELFRKALAQDPKNVTAAFNLGGILVNNKKLREAINLLETYSKAYPIDAGIFSRLGDAYFSNKQASLSVTAYEKAYELDPSYPGVLGRLATVYGLTNRSEDAERIVSLQVEQNPQDLKALASLAALQLTNRKADASISSAKRALQIKPTPEVYVTLGTAYEQKGDLKNALIAYQRAADLGDARKELKEKIEILEKNASI